MSTATEVKEPTPEAVEAAKLFHEAYERLAPEFGYETRDDTKEFDPESPNGRLMIAVCGSVVDAAIAPLRAERDRLQRENAEVVGELTVASELIKHASTQVQDATQSLRTLRGAGRSND